MEEEIKKKKEDGSVLISDRVRMDASTLRKKTSQFIHLRATNQQLQDALAEKEEMVRALEIQIRMFRQGKGDHVSLSKPEEDIMLFKDLQEMLISRDEYIRDLTENLTRRSEELAVALNREKELTNENQTLRLEVNTKLKRSEIKLNESFMESVGSKAKIEVLTSQVQEYLQTIKSLRSDLESSKLKIELQNSEIVAKDTNLEQLKFEASKDATQFKTQMEELNKQICTKNRELIQSKNELETASKSEEDRIEQLRVELENKYKNELKHFERRNKDMTLQYLRNCDSELQKSLDKSAELQIEIDLVKQLYEQQMNRYKDDLQHILDKSIFTENELAKYKVESNKYKKLVDSFKLQLSEEINKIKSECYETLEKSLADTDENVQIYKGEIDKLSQELKVHKENETMKEFELEKYRGEFNKKNESIRCLEEEIITMKDAFEKSEEEYKSLFNDYERKVNDLKETNLRVHDELNELMSNKNHYKNTIFELNEKIESNENDINFLENELTHYKQLNHKSQERLRNVQQNEEKLKSQLKESQQQLSRLNENIKCRNEQFDKYKADNQRFQKQIENLTETIEHNSTLHQGQVNYFSASINEQALELASLKSKLSDSEWAIKIDSSKQNYHFMLEQKDFLLQIWKGLTSIKTLINGQSKELVLLNHNYQNIDQNKSLKEIMAEVQNTLDDLISITSDQYGQTGCLSPRQNKEFQPAVLKHEGNTGQVWATKVAILEKENASLKQDVKLLKASLRDMESCNAVFSQESELFNTKFQFLNNKITELENNNMLKKEINDKNQQWNGNESKKELSSEINAMRDSSLKPEQMIDKNISEALERAMFNESNTDIETILEDLLGTSDDVGRKTRTRSLLESLSSNRNLCNLSLSDNSSINVTDSQASPKHMTNPHDVQSHVLSQSQENWLRGFPMPTIAEEGDNQEVLWIKLQTEQYQVSHGQRALTRCTLALTQLLSVLFDGFTSSVMKLFVPWKGKCRTLERNFDLHTNRINVIDCLKAATTSQETAFASDLTFNIPEECIETLIQLKDRLKVAHAAIFQSINIQGDFQVEMGSLILQLTEDIRQLQTDKEELEKNHRSAIELLIKDHENELEVMKSLLEKMENMHPVKIVTEDSEIIRRNLEHEYQKQMEELRMYYEKKCSDLEKNYCEEVYSQSQQSCKESDTGSMSDLSHVNDLFGAGEEETSSQASEEKIHSHCEKTISELKQLNSLKENHTESEKVKSECEFSLSVSTCKACRKNNLIDINNKRNKESEITLEQYFAEKTKETPIRPVPSFSNTELELKLYEIKEDVRKDYEQELEKMRDEILTYELKKKDEEINSIKNQLNEAHQIQLEKLRAQYEQLASREAEKSALRVKNEVEFAQNLEDKIETIEFLKSENEKLEHEIKCITEENEKAIDELKAKLKQSHKKEVDHLKQAFEIELTTRVQTVLEEKARNEGKLNNLIEAIQEELKSVKFQQTEIQFTQPEHVQQLTDSIRKDILRALELQIKELVSSGEERGDWPPELAALEHQFRAKYQQQLAQFVKEHALEMAELKADYENKLSQLVNGYSINQEVDLPKVKNFPQNEDLNKIVKERDNLRSLALTMRQVVQQLASYLTSCEDELNKSIVGELMKMTSSLNGFKNHVHGSEDIPSDPESETTDHKRVHFAPDVSSIVSMLEEDGLLDCLDTSVDASVHFRSELEACLKRLREEASTVLGLTQVKPRLPSDVEDRRLSSITRQLIEEKKAKEEALRQLEYLQQMFHHSEQELIEVHKELIQTKENMMKENAAAETEYNEKVWKNTANKLSVLQEKARILLSEKGECPHPWIGLIEELCASGDSLIEEAWSARDQLQCEIDAADKQLRSTRAFLEEQAVEREQERDEFTKEMAILREQLRGKDRDWTSHHQYSAEVEALEKQVQDTTDLLKETEERKAKLEEELKTAVDKIWVLRNIISELEVQVCSRGEREAGLEKRLVQLEIELESQAHKHGDVHQQLGQSGDNQDLQQDQPPQSPGRPVLCQIKSQIRGLVRSLEKPIKELECLNIHVSSASLSSPSEDISVREQLEALRCSTPEDKKSTPSSPVHIEEISLLNDKLQRYSRAAETIIKQLQDKGMEIKRLKSHNEELVTERDVLQDQCERQLRKLATLHNKAEELRGRNERDTAAAVAPLHQRILHLERHMSQLTEKLTTAQRQVAKLSQKLDRSESIMASQESELSSLSQHQQVLVDKLRQDLAAMKMEKQQLQSMVEKYREEDNVSLPLLVEVMLAEKNADIDQLQQRVEELEAQQEHKLQNSNQSKGRGQRVSFADDTSRSQLGEGDRARDAVEGTSIKPVFSTPFSSFESGEKRCIPRTIGGDISYIREPSMINRLSSSPSRTVQLESVLTQLKMDLEYKTQRLLECEAQLAEVSKVKEELLVTLDREKREHTDQLIESQRLLAEKETELAEVKAGNKGRDDQINKHKTDLEDLRDIMEGLQQKLQETKLFAKDLEEQVTALKKDLLQEQAASKSKQEMIRRLEKEKQNILSELVMSKSKCKGMQNDLENALKNVTENKDTILSLAKDLEESLKENENLKADSQQLRREFDKLSRKQKAELMNMMKRDSDEANKLKEEIVSLKAINLELQSACDKLQKDLCEAGNRVSILNELNSKDNKIQQLETELHQLGTNIRSLKEEKLKTENSLNKEIFTLKSLMNDFKENVGNISATSNQSQVTQGDTDIRDAGVRKYEILKRDYVRERRARREIEKKCTVLKEELMKEKLCSSRINKGEVIKEAPRLGIARACIIDVRPDGLNESSSLDDLTDEVQKELNMSAQLDHTLMTGLQQTAEPEQLGRSEMLPPRTEFLHSRLAEVETALHVEHVVVNELRARLVEEHTRYMDQRVRADTLARDLAEAQILNDQVQDKFSTVAFQLEQQVAEMKELRQQAEPATLNSFQIEKLKRMVEEYQKRVEELTQERECNRDQLACMSNELVTLRAARMERHHFNRDNVQAMEKLKDQVEEERRRNAVLQSALDKSLAEVMSLCSQHDTLKKKLKEETEARKTIQEKLNLLQLVDKNRLERRRVADEKQKELVVRLEKDKRMLEQDCAGIQLKLKQANLQLRAQSAGSPVGLRLQEANAAVERLVREKEELNSTNVALKEETVALKRSITKLEDMIEELKTRIQSLNIKVTDGGVDNLNALFAAEREAWLKEKEALKSALTQNSQVCSSTNGFYNCTNSHHILQKCLRAESHRLALVFQKHYLLARLKGYEESDRHVFNVLMHKNALQLAQPLPVQQRRFRVTAFAVRAVFRFLFVVQRHQRTRHNTCQILKQVLNNPIIISRPVENISEMPYLWRRTEDRNQSNSEKPTTPAQYQKDFHSVLDRIRTSLSSD